MEPEPLSELIGTDQLPPLVLALSRLAGLPACLLDRDGSLLASSSDLKGFVLEEAQGSGVRILSFPVAIGGVKRATLLLGPYRVHGRHTPSGDLLPVLTHLRVEEAKARAGTLVQLLEDMGVRALDLRKEREERHRAEEAARAHEQQFRILVNQMNEGILAGDLATRITFVNPKMAALLDYTEEELLGRPFYELMEESYREDYLARIKLRHTGLSETYETVLVRKDGNRLNILVSAVPLRDEEGRVIGSSAIMSDITERKNAEEALRRSEERYRLIVDNVQDIIFTHLPDGTVSFVSESVRHLGYRPEECVGQGLFEFVHPEDLDVARGAFARTMTTHQGTSVEVRVKSRNGEYVWMEEKSDPVIVDSRVDQVTCVLRDISKRRSTEDALRLSEYKYGRIINNIRDIVYSYYPDGTLSFVSESVRQMGWDHREIVGRNLFEFLHPKDHAIAREAVERAVQEGVFAAVECRLRTKPGEYVWVEANSEPIFVGGNLVQINGVARYITERKAAEEALRLSEENYRRLVNNLQDIIYSVGSDGVVSLISGSVRRLGYEPEEIEGHRIFDFLHPEDQAGAQKSFERVLAGEAPEHLEMRIRTRDGRYVWFEENDEPIFQAGALVQVNAVARDITERKAAENALRESEDRYRWLLEQLNEGILVSDLDSVITFVNPRMAEMLGYSVEELVGKPDDILLGDDGIPANRERSARRVRGISDQYEIQLMKKNGEPVHFMASGTPLRSRDGEIVGSFGVLNDITEWKRDREELRRLSAAIEQASDSIIIADTRGTILYANPASQVLTGIPLPELVGNGLDALRGQRQSEDFYRQIWNTVRKGETWSGHLANVRSDGTRYETMSTISPVRDTKGKIQYVVASSRDISREAELEAQLRHSQRMEAIGVMAGGIAHDFNNILTPVMGYTEMALSRPGLDPKLEDYLKEIAGAGRRATELVQQILTFSRQTEQIKKPVPVGSIVKESLKLLRAAIPSTITIRQRIGAGDAQVYGDASQIHQVVMNLCTNAFHAMRERGGIMEVALDALALDAPLALLGATLAPGAYLRLRIRDTGLGMDEETRKKIFLPFFTTKGVGEGTGLGLSIVHGIVMGMGGSIGVESEMGEGSTFTVYLPSIQPVSEAAPSGRTAIPAGSERLVVVDDEGAIGSMLQDALVYFGYQVRIFTSSSAALQAFRAAPDEVDLVVTDLTMPELTGLELARHIWEAKPGFPMVLMTGYTENLDEVSARELGFSALLRKPVPLALIGQVVRGILDRRREAVTGG